MTDEGKRCGTCKWWSVATGFSPSSNPDRVIGNCSFPLPFFVQQILPYAEAGKDCATWHAK